MSESLIDAARRGEPEALQAIARAELPRVERLLGKILGPRQDLEDLTQNVFLELCRALPGFRGDSKLSSFVGGITIRVARRAMRPSAWTRRRADEEVEAVDDKASAERLAETREGLRRARAAIEHLSENKRIAFLLWALDGRSTAEIADLMDASVSATRSRIYYAQKELRQAAAADPVLRAILGDAVE